jgi:hypothetical protein
MHLFSWQMEMCFLNEARIELGHFNETIDGDNILLESHTAKLTHQSIHYIRGCKMAIPNFSSAACSNRTHIKRFTIRFFFSNFNYFQFWFLLDLNVGLICLLLSTTIEEHWSAVKRILRFINDTLGHDFHLRSSLCSSLFVLVRIWLCSSLFVLVRI